MNEEPDLKAEIDFRDLIRKPHKLFGYSYIYFLVILTIVGIAYMENITIIGKNSAVPIVLADSTAFAQDIPYRSASFLPPVDVMTAAKPTPELLEKGKALFQANCSSCHGDNGEGNGPASITLNPKPRNFHVLTGWTRGSKISQIYTTLQEGVPNTGMASFSYMAPLDRFALIHYVRSFSTSQPTDSQTELQGLETTYNLSKGTNTPGQIPVRKAVRIIEQEEAPVVKEVAQLAESDFVGAKGPGLDIFNRVVKNKSRVFAGLLYNNQSSLQNLDQFVRVVTAAPIELGFKEEVVRLSPSEWSVLYQFLSDLKAHKGVS